VNSYGNKYLCGGSEECVQEIPKTRNNSKNVVLGITISGCLAIVFALMVGIALYRRKLREKRLRNKDYSMIMSKLTKSRAFTGKEMADATEDFSTQIGQGGSGSVFLGKLREEKDIAVKVLSSLHQFLNEVDVLSRAQHRNLVSLIGYCSESKNLMLIYEHMSGGSLWDSLHGRNADHSNLNWKTRLRIALDAAQGLEFLHVGCTPKIIHRDVKTANILLDDQMNAKLADFGISRITSDGEASHATTSMAKGTPGYIDPEYRRTHEVTEKSDVYSFGVVLFEIICGRPATHASHEEDLNLVEWVRPYVKGDEIGAEVIDTSLNGNYSMESIALVAKLALRCVEDRPYSRPTISEVVGEIKEAIIHENENNAQFPVSDAIGIQYGDLQSQPSPSGKSKDVEWVEGR